MPKGSHRRDQRRHPLHGQERKEQPQSGGKKRRRRPERVFHPGAGVLALYARVLGQ